MAHGRNTRQQQQQTRRIHRRVCGEKTIETPRSQLEIDKKKAVDKITIKCYLRNAFTHSDLFRKRKGTVSLAGVLSKLGAGNSISHAIGGRESEAVKCVH